MLIAQDAIGEYCLIRSLVNADSLVSSVKLLRCRLNEQMKVAIGEILL